jgi:hypothetical protein
VSRLVGSEMCIRDSIFIIRVNNMKYQVGDLVLLKHYEWKLRRRAIFSPIFKPVSLLHLMNSFGMITQAVNHNDYWKGETTSDDNVYVWFSQLDAKEYNFCEDEVTGEVIK